LDKENLKYVGLLDQQNGFGTTYLHSLLLLLLQGIGKPNTYKALAKPNTW
jgi:hypothetical protein